MKGSTGVIVTILLTAALVALFNTSADKFYFKPTGYDQSTWMGYFKSAGYETAVVMAAYFTAGFLVKMI